jgi:hypothetical protein
MMVQGANDNLGAQSVPRLVREFPKQVAELARPGTFVSVARKVLKISAADAGYLDAIPSALREGMRAAITDALANGKSVQMQYSPGYDFSVQLWDYGEALSVHISGPYEVGGRSYRAKPKTAAKPARRKATRKASARKATRKAPARAATTRKAATRRRTTRRGR